MEKLTLSFFILTTLKKFLPLPEARQELLGFESLSLIHI